MLETSLGSIARLKSFEQAVQPEDRPAETHIPPQSWPDKGAIEFHAVTASHRLAVRVLSNTPPAVLIALIVQRCLEYVA
jgi:hypothetical protein